MPTSTSSRPQTRQPPSRDPALDGLRGVAILLVFLFHYGGGLHSGNAVVRTFGYLTEAGWAGVHLFFALSGFLITGLLWDGRGRAFQLRNFYARRALRILPLYFLALLLAALFALARGAHTAQLQPLLVYVFFAQNLPWLVPLALHYPPPLPLHHLWSLAVEEQFYLLWPFLLRAAATRRRALHLCLATFGLCCLFRIVVFTPGLLRVASHLDWSPFLLTRAGALALGSALALTRLPRRQLRRRAQIGLALGLALLVTTAAVTGSFLLARPLQFIVSIAAVDLAAAALLALSLYPGMLRSPLSNIALGALGRISYGVYVFHVLLEPLFDRIALHLTHSPHGSAYQAVRLLAGFPITIGVATASWLLLEQPMLRYKRFFPQPVATPVLKR